VMCKPVPGSSPSSRFSKNDWQQLVGVWGSVLEPEFTSSFKSARHTERIEMTQSVR